MLKMSKGKNVFANASLGKEDGMPLLQGPFGNMILNLSDTTSTVSEISANSGTFAPSSGMPPSAKGGIAVVAVSCRLPGVEGPDAFWQTIVEGKSPIREVPDSWLDPELYFDPNPGKFGKTYSRLAAIFDTERLEKEIAEYPFPEQFQSKDPVLKLACIVAEETLSRMIRPQSGSRVGVYVGGLRASDLSNDYILSVAAPAVFESLRELPEFADLSVAAQSKILRRSVQRAVQRFRHEERWKNRSPNLKFGDFAADLRNSFDWIGPALTLDAACSSSLVALDCARADLLSGRVDGALVGAVSAMTKLSLILFSKNFAAARSKSRPFDTGADGVVGSMGIVFVFLKTLEQAEKDRDTILGVIRGLGFSSDGRGKSLWAPRAEGQMLALRRAFDDAGRSPEQLSYLEAHATSTGVGDSTEMKTIGTFFSEKRSDGSETEPSKLAVGSVKAHFGHPFEAAGLVGLMKVLMMIRHNTIPSQINISELHELCRDHSFYVPLQETPLRPDPERARLYGVNAFGVGGLNSHLILEEYRPDLPQETALGDLTSPIPIPPIAVLGAGCVYPGAYSLDGFWTLLGQRIDPKSSLSQREQSHRFFSGPQPEKGTFPEADDVSDHLLTGGFIEDYLYDWERHRIPPLQIERSDPLQTYILGAVDEAMGGAFPGREIPESLRRSVAVVVGADHETNFFHEFVVSVRVPELAEILKEEMQSLLESEAGHEDESRWLERIDNIARDFTKRIVKKHACLSDVTGSFSASSLASRITKIYDFHGGAYTIDAGDVSSSVALDHLVRKIAEGKCSVGVCAGGYRWTNIHAVQYHAAENPRSAFPLAEGAGALVLKSLEHLDPSRELPLGFIRSIVPVRQGEIAPAFWEAAGYRIDELAFVSLASSDPARHLELLAESFQKAGRTQALPITSSRGQLGNLCSGAGLSELIKTLLILKNRRIPTDLESLPLPDGGLLFSPETTVEISGDAPFFAIVFDLDRNGNGYAILLEPAQRYVSPPSTSEANGSADATGIRVKEIVEIPPYLRSFPPHAPVETNQIPLPVFRQIGTPYEMGLGIGVADAEEIHRTIDFYERLSSKQKNDLPTFESFFPRAEILFGTDGLDELRGVADGACVDFDKLFLHNIIFYGTLFVESFISNVMPRNDASDLRGAHGCRFVSTMNPLPETSLALHLKKREPILGRAHILLGGTGCIGGIFGWNRTGLSLALHAVAERGRKNDPWKPRASLLPFRQLGRFLERFADLDEWDQDGQSFDTTSFQAVQRGTGILHTIGKNPLKEIDRIDDLSSILSTLTIQPDQGTTILLDATGRLHMVEP